MLPLRRLFPTLTALLSSSCCIIQLLLNLFSFSCVGFSIFTPYRPIFTTITILLLSYESYNRGLKSRHVLISVVICTALMVSPELVQWVNQSNIIASPAEILVGSTELYYNYRIHLDGLRCEACANKIKAALNSIHWIHSARIFFNNQTAIVQTITNENVLESLIQEIKSIDENYSAQIIDSWTSLKGY
ncbi:MAG: hypothetical protein EXX96DRAFT_151496 [Benjaminiella poitrasii]|nr:MAG: hypothetical protein EXX96DRAFT_151496 [Benjaminiella poitrasii]